MADIDAKKIEELRGLYARFHATDPDEWRDTMRGKIAREILKDKAFPALLDLAERASIPLAGDVERSDLLVSLIRAGATGDREMLRSTTEAMVAEERAKKHFIVADRMQRALAAVPITPPSLTASSPHQTGPNGREAILEITPQLQLEDLLLPLPARESGRQLLEEHRRADVLRTNGYEPRHRVLLSGPPGNGKTSFAEAIAEGLGLPFFVVRYDALIGSYLGETNARLRKLFDYARTTPSVLFFDEFDAIGKERGDTHETGEIKRVVSFLLMQLDQLPSYVIVVAATNHGELLDRAVWRRFQMRLSFPAPKKTDVTVFLDRIISGWPDAPKLSLSRLAGRLGDVSYAEALDFCQNVRRRQILGLGEVSVDEALRAELDLWASRVTPELLNAERSAALARALEEAKEALRPFSEAASKAQISGCPPFQFCDARDYARARAILEPGHEG